IPLASVFHIASALKRLHVPLRQIVLNRKTPTRKVRKLFLLHRPSLGREWRTAARDLERHGAHLFVDQPVGGKNDRAAKLIRIPGKIAHFAAGFFDQQNAGSSIPFRKAEFPETVKAAGCHRGEIERGGTIAADSVRVLREVAIILKIRAELSVAYRKTSTEQARRKRRIFGNADFLAVEGGAFAACGSKKFVVKRIADCGSEKRISLRESDRNTEARIAMSEIRRAIQRINVPTKFRSRRALMPRSLFGSDSMLGKVFRQPLNDQPLRAFVGLRDKIHLVAFVGDVQRARQFFDQDLSGFLRDLDGGVKIILWHLAIPRALTSPKLGPRALRHYKNCWLQSLSHSTTGGKLGSLKGKGVSHATEIRLFHFSAICGLIGT